MAEGPLSGVKLIEYCSFVAGPYCTKLFADLGAEVIKVEAPEGDEARRRGPFWDDNPNSELSGLFLYHKTNKM
jgi:crotonobetainyl-CoA:carnitine CoA-transferase CaiB-like acyl-CoA transferase